MDSSPVLNSPWSSLKPDKSGHYCLHFCWHTVLNFHQNCLVGFAYKILELLLLIGLNFLISCINQA